jgi:hypothetical protein
MEAAIKSKVDVKYKEMQLRTKAISVGICPDCGYNLVDTEECLSDELGHDKHCINCDVKHTIWY